jgi:hypothetical protein
MIAEIREIGWKAHAALTRSAGRWTLVPEFAGSAFRLADGEPIFLGSGNVAMHPRTVALHPHLALPDRLCVHATVPWRSAPIVLGENEKRVLHAGCIALAAGVRDIGVPQGLAVLLAGCEPAFPLDHATAHVKSIATAIDDDDAHLAQAAALPLLGLGPGLTPSGDDFVGALLFARRLLDMDAQWMLSTRRLVAAAQTRTHAIGAALFGDLAEGRSFGALHRLVECLVARDQALPAARDLAAIGHSSGWDMLTGFVIGVAGTAALPERTT